jgi:hypothetical protein
MASRSTPLQKPCFPGNAFSTRTFPSSSLIETCSMNMAMAEERRERRDEGREKMGKVD